MKQSIFQIRTNKDNNSMNVRVYGFMQSCKHAIVLLLVLVSAASAQFKLPKYEVVALDNGLTIYLMEKKDVPLISFSAVFDAGAIRDGEIKGLSSFTAEALKFGTKNYTKNQIDSIFNFYGSSLSTYARLD